MYKILLKASFLYYICTPKKHFMKEYYHHLHFLQIKNRLLKHSSNNSNKGNAMKLWEVMDMPMTLRAVMVSLVYIYPQTHPLVCNKYVQLFTCQSYLNKAVSKAVYF